MSAISNDLQQRAIRAYFRRFGPNAMQPSAFSDVHRLDGKDYVVLSNTFGSLAVYRLKAGHLEFVDDAPEEIAA